VVSVRCGGHSVAGLSISDGIVIDLAGLKRIEVDADRKVARAGGGVLWGEFDHATQEHGLHAPGGRVTTTGLGGFTTGGGYGWTSSKHGLTCDNLISAEVVTADGSVLTASEVENEDLFWGIRGGGNFGIVTKFDFRLHELGPIVLAGLALWPIDRASEVLRGWRDYVDGAPNELSTACVILTAPPEEFVPDHLKGQLAIGMAATYVGDRQEGAAVVQPLKDLRPEVDLIGPDAIHGVPGDPRPKRSPREAQLLARRVHGWAQRRRDRHLHRARAAAGGGWDAAQPDDHLPDRPGRHRGARRRERLLSPRREVSVPPDLGLGGPG
jgi:FAD/FMN-containing dehydrogenase